MSGPFEGIPFKPLPQLPIARDVELEKSFSNTPRVEAPSLATRISEEVRVLERNYAQAKDEAGTMNATLIVNFGETGRVIPGVLKNTDRGVRALVLVLERLVAERDAARREADGEKEILLGRGRSEALGEERSAIVAWLLKRARYLGKNYRGERMQLEACAQQIQAGMHLEDREP